MSKPNPFDTIKIEIPQTNFHDLSFSNRLTMDIGTLVPCYVEEVLPNDVFEITPSMLARFQPLVYPIPHKIEMFIHFFYCVNRLLWEPWPEFLKGTAVVKPFIQGTVEVPFEVTAGSIYDYMGLPISDNIKEEIDVFPFLAYGSIFNNYFQDQYNDSRYQPLADSLLELSKKTGALVPADFDLDAWSDMPIWRRAWQKDMFTSALPKANVAPTVNIPIELADAMLNTVVQFGSGEDVLTGDLKLNTGIITVDNGVDPEEPATLQGQTEFVGEDVTIEASITQLRYADHLMLFYEKLGRGGKRYNELMMILWGVDIGDDRISRPVYLGGVVSTVNISEVVQTSETATTPLGNFAGHASGLISGNKISYRCKEHGWIIGIVSLRPETVYYQGIPKKFTRKTYLDYFLNDFVGVSEQAILNKEIYYDSANPSIANNEFGYQPYGVQYKYHPSEVHGEFRTTLLDFTLVRDFSSTPALASSFIYIDPNEQRRIFAVTEEGTHPVLAHIYFDVPTKRKIPFYTDAIGL